MRIQFIKAPTSGVMQMIARRAAERERIKEADPGAVGLVQGPLADMIAAADVAEKAAEVWVEEIRGICPQHFTMIAILGDIADVAAALEAVKKRFTVIEDILTDTSSRRTKHGEVGQ
jgi:ethanolamine utilization microcompartment shell protein EutS